MRSWTLLLSALFLLVLLATPAVCLAQDASGDPVIPAVAPEVNAEAAAQSEVPSPSEGAVPVAEVDVPAAAVEAAVAATGNAASQSGDGAAPAVNWDDFEDPGFDPEAAAAAPAAPDPSATRATSASGRVTSRGHTVNLGPQGVDSEGHIGRIHVVVGGDTLWDISEAYLGTPWVWPSVWIDNLEIANPHLIKPGDHIWITANEMRPITPEEANRMISGATNTGDEPAAQDIGFEATEEPEIAASVEEEVAVTDEAYPADAMEGLPIAVPKTGSESRLTGRQLVVNGRENMSFMKDELLAAATMIVGSPQERNYMSMPDLIYLGLGEGEVAVGDQFTFFRNTTPVYHPRTRKLLGHYVDVMGWAEVEGIRGDTSVARIRSSREGTTVGDRAIERVVPSTVIDVRVPEPGIEGIVAFLPASRTLAGTSDYVVLDVGIAHGIQVGTDLEIFEPGDSFYDEVKGARVRTPDHVLADLVVVSVEEESSVAFVVHTRHEIGIGDRIRGTTGSYPASF